MSECIGLFKCSSTVDMMVSITTEAVYNASSYGEFLQH